MLRSGDYSRMDDRTIVIEFSQRGYGNAMKGLSERQLRQICGLCIFPSGYTVRYQHNTWLLEDSTSSSVSRPVGTPSEESLVPPSVSSSTPMT